MHQNNCFLEVHETPQIPRKCLHGYDREQLRLLKHIMKLIALPKKNIFLQKFTKLALVSNFTVKELFPATISWSNT